MSPADSPFAQLPAPGPHPATADLRAYAAGTLAPAEEHRIEAHTLDCERCADLVEGFSMSDAATTDHAVAELRTRLQARLGQPETEPVAAGWAWPRIAAAAALLAVVGGGIWSWEQHETAPSAATARVETTAPAAPATTAPKPALAPAASPAASLPSAVATPQATEPAGKADYAALAPARHPAARRHIVPSSAAHAAVPEQADDSKTVAGEAARPTGTDEQPRETELARAAAAPPASASPAARAAADTAVSLSEVAVASPMRKPKARASDAASAMVANTPMPADFAIKPAPVGGTPAFRDYLRREASQFEPENDTHLSGLVHVQFTVGADGQLSDLKVKRGLRADYDAEALRLVCEGPKWQPGIAGGRRAPILMEITVPF